MHWRLLVLHALRGEPRRAAAALEQLTAWQDTDDAQLRSIYDACVVIVRSAEGNAEEALAQGLPALQIAIDAQGASAEAVRDCWPHTFQAALTLARHYDAQQTLSLIADRPPGNIPPYLRAHLARGGALLNIAEGNHDTVQSDLTTAINAFGKLAYPYWHAVTQTDLAAWHANRREAEQAAPLLEQAIATLTRLRAAPALARAHALTETPTTAS